MNLAMGLISAACLLGAAALSGCTVSVEPGGEQLPPPVGRPVAVGEVTVNWLVDGSTSPAACLQYGVSEMEIVVYDETGQPVQRETPPCGSFSITLPLERGTYSVDVTLISPRGRPVSTTKTLQAVNVIPGTNLAINVDFPSSSLR